MPVHLKEDPGVGAIEMVVRETARGRAFLEEYARRVRQSDVLTLLAMVTRLERWSEEQAALLAKIEVQEIPQQSRASAPGSDDAIGRESSRPYMNARAHTAQVSDHLIDDTTRRLENLVTLITDLGRRREGLRPRTEPAEVQVSVIDSQVLDANVIDATIIDHDGGQPAHQAVPAISWNEYPSPPASPHSTSNDEDVLDEIAKALG